MISKIDKIRKSFDSKVNEHGKKLIQLCTSNNLCILNGRKEGDSIGKFTFISKRNEASTVNFTIASENLYEDVSNFVVNAQTFLSDHSQISLWISQDNMKISNKSDLTYENNAYKLPDSFLSQKKSKIDFKNAFGSTELQRKIEEFRNMKSENNQTSVNKANTLLSDIILTAATNFLPYWKTRRKRKTKKIRKKWFNRDCERARKFVKSASKKKHADPSNTKERKVLNDAVNQFLKKIAKETKTNFGT